MFPDPPPIDDEAFTRKLKITVAHKGFHSYGQMAGEAWYRWSVVSFSHRVIGMNDEVYEAIEEKLGWYERRVQAEAGDPFARAIHVSLDDDGWHALVDQNGGLDI